MRITLLISALLALLPCIGAARSAKRGLGWDESAVKVNARHASLLEPGVAWIYNWGPDAGNPDIYGEDFPFVPMAWNDQYNASRIRAWLSAHPETKYLLGFNEPNFADQAAMTPERAAKAWPALEKIAEEFGVSLVAPALNFSGSTVGGKVWGIYEWYDEFFRLLPDARVDCLALHCYMNWYTAMNWFATEYFYRDLYDPANANYGKYPNLVKFLDGFKAARGRFPRMMLTEFCAWENDGSIYGPDFQIDQMTQKVQMLETSDLVEGYAWFMGNYGGGTAYPYMSVFRSNSATADLSDLGKVYVNMSAFDKSHFYEPGELIQAKDYVGATTDNNQVRVRPNSETESTLPLQIELPPSGYPEYQIDAPLSGSYAFNFHVKASNLSKLRLYVDSKRDEEVVIPGTGEWTDVGVVTELAAGRHTVMVYNAGAETFALNALQFDGEAGVQMQIDDKPNCYVSAIYTLQGVAMPGTEISALVPGIYIIRKSNGQTTKLTIK